MYNIYAISFIRNVQNETENRLVVAYGWEKKDGGELPHGYGFLFGVMKCSKIRLCDSCTTL
jgi:hypothetical protein